VILATTPPPEMTTAMATMSDEQRRHSAAVHSMPNGRAASRYIQGLERRKEILPKSADRVLAASQRPFLNL
jgi:hypothetical protein